MSSSFFLMRGPGVKKFLKVAASFDYKPDFTAEGAKEDDWFPITDGENWIWVAVSDTGRVVSMTRYGENADTGILDICLALNVRVRDEGRQLVDVRR